VPMKRKLFPTRRLGKTGLALAAALCFAAASPLRAADKAENAFLEAISPLALVPQGQGDSEVLAKATVAVEAIKKMDLPRAHLAVNEALQLDARNSYLHFLNGFVYHLQAKQGDTQKSEIAIEGYQQALRLDPGNWIAREFLGLAHMDLKQFDRAKAQFSEVLRMTPESVVSVQGLMAAAYLSGDARTACAMADQLRKTSAAPLEPGFVRTSVVVYASCGSFEEAERMRSALAELDPGGAELQRADRRLSQWKAFYGRQEQAAVLSKTSLTKDVPPQQLAQAFPQPTHLGLPPPAAPAAPGPTPNLQSTSTSTPNSGSPEPAVPQQEAVRAVAAGGGNSPRMLLIDVVLLSTQELVSTSKGVNLLSALTLQLGSVSGNVSAYSKVTSSTDPHTGSPAAVSTAITRAVTIPALSYSLNIANANSSVNEVLARPTLAAIEGLPSEFFSGTNLSAGVVSTSTQGGTTVVPLDKRFGIKLAVTPVFLAGGQVQLKVDAQRTSLNPGADNPKVAYQIEIAEIMANANVVMNLGDTLVLSGLSEKSFVNNRDGVPVLQDVPVLQYLFSNRRATELQRSVLILVTPRSPVQTAAAERAGATPVDDMQALRERFGLSARVPANVEAILNQLQPSDLFREFRQGDVAMERWDRVRTTGERLKEALAFLYY
jgi:pilus assembly protein CpaC